MFGSVRAEAAEGGEWLRRATSNQQNEPNEGQAVRL
jgi:hypothetical protein